MQQQDPLVNEKERLEEGLSLLERIKEILKKFGITVTATVLAAGTVIDAVIGAITNALKNTWQGHGKRSEGDWQKTASNFPSLIGSIVSFIFKTIPFLPEHTWLLIVTAVAFLLERFIITNNSLFSCQIM